MRLFSWKCRQSVQKLPSCAVCLSRPATRMPTEGRNMVCVFFSTLFCRSRHFRETAP